MWGATDDKAAQCILLLRDRSKGLDFGSSGGGWETFLTTGEITNFGEDRIDLADLEPEDCREKSNCCSAPDTG